MPTRIPDSAVCLDCGYLLRGLPEEKCPECGRPFDADDPNTYEIPEAEKQFRVTPSNLAGTGMGVYICCLLVLGILDPGTVKGAVSMSIQPVLMAAGTALAVFAVCWAWRRRERRVLTTFVAGILLLTICTIHLPSYLSMRGEIATIRASVQQHTGD